MFSSGRPTAEPRADILTWGNVGPGTWQAWRMSEMMGLLVAFAIGLPLLGAAILLDWRHRRRSEGPASDGGEHREGPRYITQSEIDSLPRRGQGMQRRDKPTGTRLPFGYADPDFATAGRLAEHHDARVLVVDGTITDAREIMTPLTHHRPLVLVARGMHPEVLATLIANRRALDLPVLVALTDEPAVAAEHTGAEPLTPADLQAGYVPGEALGRAATWISDPEQTWITHTDE